MKKIALIPVSAYLLFAASCNNSVKSKLAGTWKSRDGDVHLKITGKQFTMDSDSPVPEDYFIKGDTIFTSFQGNQPYTRFVIQKLDEHNLKLFYPDSTAVEFVR